jgi:proline iminopeptidase
VPPSYDDRVPTTHEGFVTVDGNRTWYRRYEGDGTGTPLLMLHGGPGGPWPEGLDALPALAERRPVIIYDQLGCGRSDRPGDPTGWTIDAFLTELQAVRDQLGLDEVHLYGWSWGGMLALAYALGRPTGVQSLILHSALYSSAVWAEECSRLRRELDADVQAAMARFEDAFRPKPPERTKPKPGRTTAQLERDGRIMERLIPILTSRVTHRLAIAASRVPFLRRTSYNVLSLDYARRFVLRLDPLPSGIFVMFAGMNGALFEHMWGPSEYMATGTLRDFDVTDRLGEITEPTLVLSGRYDEATPLQMQTLTDGIPNAEWVLFEESAHCAILEEPERFATAVDEFLRKVDA